MEQSGSQQRWWRCFNDDSLRRYVDQSWFTHIHEITTTTSYDYYEQNNIATSLTPLMTRARAYFELMTDVCDFAANTSNFRINSNCTREVISADDSQLSKEYRQRINHFHAAMETGCYLADCDTHLIYMNNFGHWIGAICGRSAGENAVQILSINTRMRLLNSRMGFNFCQRNRPIEAHHLSDLMRRLKASNRNLIIYSNNEGHFGSFEALSSPNNSPFLKEPPTYPPVAALLATPTTDQCIQRDYQCLHLYQHVNWARFIWLQQSAFPIFKLLTWPKERLNEWLEEISLNCPAIRNVHQCLERSNRHGRWWHHVSDSELNKRQYFLLAGSKFFDSAWMQPEMFRYRMDAITDICTEGLAVDFNRHHTCFGPVLELAGDRRSVKTRYQLEAIDNILDTGCYNFTCQGLRSYLNSVTSWIGKSCGRDAAETA